MISPISGKTSRNPNMNREYNAQITQRNKKIRWSQILSRISQFPIWRWRTFGVSSGAEYDVAGLHYISRGNGRLIQLKDERNPTASHVLAPGVGFQNDLAMKWVIAYKAPNARSYYDPTRLGNGVLQ
jgi:hypothetical protein